VPCLLGHCYDYQSAFTTGLSRALLCLLALSCRMQFKVIARVVLSMVDTIPCIGGANISLLSVPHVDCTVRLFNGPDLMALPGIKELTKFIIGVRPVALQASHTTQQPCHRLCLHLM